MTQDVTGIICNEEPVTGIEPLTSLRLTIKITCRQILLQEKHLTYMLRFSEMSSKQDASSANCGLDKCLA